MRYEQQCRSIGVLPSPSTLSEMMREGFGYITEGVRVGGIRGGIRSDGACKCVSLLFVAREKTSRDEVERRVDALARWKLWEKYKRKKRGNALEKDRQRERERERER